MATAIIRNQYRLPLFGRPDPDFERGLKVAGSIGLVVLILALVVPKQTAEMETVDDVPERSSSRHRSRGTRRTQREGPRRHVRRGPRRFRSGRP